MNPNTEIDGLDLDLDEQSLAIVQANNQQGTRQHGAGCAWTPISNANAMTAQPYLAAQQQAPENRIPGPAGRPTTLPNGSAKSVANGGGAAGGWAPAEFMSSEWQAGLRLLNLTEFQESHPLLQGNTVQAAITLKQSGIIPKLLLYIVSMHHTHNGESYVKFKDPTGTIGATLVSDVLSIHQDITRGAVVLLEKVTVLRTPPPHSIHHLCIVPENVVRVIPRQRSQSAGLPFFSSSPPASGGGGGGNDANKDKGVGAPSAGGEGPPRAPGRLVNRSDLQQPSQLENRNNSPAIQVLQGRQVQQQQVPAPVQQQPQQQPANYVQPQLDTADDLLDGLDDEFGF